LKHDITDLLVGGDNVRARVPEKQGLKHILGSQINALENVRARVPEKQGLKQLKVEAYSEREEVRARVPEKQGLKRRSGGSERIPPLGPGASSRKTRIETHGRGHERDRGRWSGREFQKNKD